MAEHIVPDSNVSEGGQASTSSRCRKEDIQYRQVTFIGHFPMFKVLEETYCYMDPPS